MPRSRTGTNPGVANPLGDFLRARRATLRPVDVGQPDRAGHRRVPGLRREEVAALAHVSVDYVTRLEQGRTRRASASVLDALSDALRLDADGRAYLYAAAEVMPSSSPLGPGRPEVAPELHRLLASMPEVPALVLHRRMDVWAWNQGAARLLTDFGALAERDRNLIRLTFLEPGFRALYVDWARVAHECVAVLRMEVGREPRDLELATLVDELNAVDPDFRTWWARHDVRSGRELRKAYRHPLVGELTLDVQQFSVASHPEQLLVVYTAPPHSASAAGLQRLLQAHDAMPPGPTEDRSSAIRLPGPKTVSPVP